jgi:hypothetical protein
MVLNHQNTYHVFKIKKGTSRPLSYCTESVVMLSAFVVSTLVVSVTTAVESVVVDSVLSPDPQDASVKVDKIASAMKILFIDTKLIKET